MTKKKILECKDLKEEQNTKELWYAFLAKLSRIKKIPRRIRELTGKKVIDYYFRNEHYNYLVKLSEDKRVPEYVRQSAGKNIGKAGKKVIKFYTQRSLYGSLESLCKNERVPEEVRQLAGETVIEYYVKEKAHRSYFLDFLEKLMKLSEDEKVPESVRKLAKEKIDYYLPQNYFLKKIFKNSKVQ